MAMAILNWLGTAPPEKTGRVMRMAVTRTKTNMKSCRRAKSMVRLIMGGWIPAFRIDGLTNWFPPNSSIRQFVNSSIRQFVNPTIPKFAN